ncbi:MAG: chemotaxis protein CheW [Planctomycetes bacterium]|nr:chemotaxis protein CheW [Planctomycetota bacterium]
MRSISHDRVYITTFTLNEQRFGVDLGYVQEYIEKLPLTMIPDPDNEFVGMANLRGQIISVFDLKKRLFGLSSDNFSVLLVIRSNSSLEKVNLDFKKEPISREPIALVTDLRGDILDLHPSQLHPPVWIDSDPTRQFVKNVVEQDDGMMLVLDLPKLFYFKRVAGQ